MKKRHYYPEHLKKQAIRLLHITGNITEVSEKLGVHRNSIRAWKQEIDIDDLESEETGEEILDEWEKERGMKEKYLEKIEKNLDRIYDDVVKTEEELAEDVLRLKAYVINRIAEVIPHTTNLDQLQHTLRTLYDIGETRLDDKRNSNMLFVQLTQKFKDYEPENPITIDGDTEE